MSELARTLRRVRTRQGLRLEDVGARTGLPLDELERLESGDVRRLEDRVATVKALRVYANALGLSGDLYALSLVEHWPPPRSPSTPAVAVDGRRGPVVVADAPTAAVPRVPGASPAITLPATTSATTTSLPVAVAVAVADGPVWPGTSSTAIAVLDTGLTPAVSGLPHRPRRHRRAGTPLWLRTLVVVVALAVVVGVAGLVIQAVQPSWLRAIGITHADHPGTAGSTAT
ncbi:MAG TPA: helix-turn-helix transcriptional regulator, partial [Acidimicrobiales bacterium]|nr:helix-turn-helix transcriptional regulator [Acidimicrobiales bacterium]